jgi:phosphate-selective porin
MKLPGALEQLEIQFAATSSDLPEGLNSLQARTLDEFAAFAPVYVSGRRLRLGAAATWSHGPLSAAAELIEARDDRRGQSISNGDVPDLVARGWYVMGTWLLTGEKKDGDSTPRRPVFDRGIGAIEVAARAEGLDFQSAGRAGPAFRNPRAANVLGNDLRLWTLGVNWYPHRFIKVQLNAIRESVADSQRRALRSSDVSWHRALRVQFVL